ncbi:phosphotransferase, partial [Leucobacter soli]|uniref:phosphotransferase n=1 Tax=Leucobacter soli TaxID=2812850 RepID=UPI003605BB0C
MPVNAATPQTLSISHDESAHLLREHYGVDPVRLTAMHSELSTVARVDLADDRSLVFRASCGTPEELEAARWRIGAMDHLAARGVPTGRTVPSADGSPIVSVELDAGPAILHVGEWLDGVMLDSAKPTPALMRSVGRVAGEVSAGLASWPAPPVDVGHPWELTRTLETVASTIVSVTDPATRAVLDAAVERFASVVAPVLPTLPRSVVHHDLHDSNLLVDTGAERISGVLDFGDMVFGPRIADLAVPAMHAGRAAEDPAEAFLLVAEGWGRAGQFENTVQLEEDEIAVVFDAGLGRLAVNLSVWTDRARSDRADYARARSSRTERTLRLLLDADRGRML